MRFVPFYKWARSVKENTWHHSCEICWSTSKLEAHHILPSAMFPELTCDIDNGICLCHDCHVILHGYGKIKRIDPSIYNNYACGHVSEKAVYVARYLVKHPELIYWNLNEDPKYRYSVFVDNIPSMSF